jgi:ubiquinol-cytochrome c reductase cytochrome b subunit
MYDMHIFVIPTAIFVLIALHLFIVWRQMHTNLPGPRRTNQTIVGSRLWPSYTFKSLGLFLLLFGIIAMVGGLVQIDPVWIYGPYDPVAIAPGAQPDWYLGWIEGAMRLFPGINLRIGGELVPEVFFPAVLFPALVFAILYFYPFIEEFLSSDRKQHNVLLLPYQQPFNTAVGCSGIMFLLVLLFAGGDDVVAISTGSSVVEVRTLLRILVFLAPAVTWVVVYLLCVGSRRRHAEPGPRDGLENAIVVEQTLPQQE